MKLPEGAPGVVRRRRWLTLVLVLEAFSCREMSTPTPSSASTPALQVTAEQARMVPAEDAGGRLEHTVEDGVAIKAALLAEIEKSEVEHRDHLLTTTRGAPVEKRGSELWIGQWHLRAEADHLRLMQRMGPYPVALFYGAKAQRVAGEWTVTSFGPGIIHWKR